MINVEDITQLESILRHIDNVQVAARLLSKRLIDRGDIHLAKMLLLHSLSHDASKFSGIQFEFLRVGADPEKLKLAHRSHVLTNYHHAEAWGGIQEMPVVFLAELVCDWHARSSEIGTDLRSWIKLEASKKFKFSVNGSIYKQIKKFVDLLLEPKMGVIK